MKRIGQNERRKRKFTFFTLDNIYIFKAERGKEQQKKQKGTMISNDICTKRGGLRISTRLAPCRSELCTA